VSDDLRLLPAPQSAERLSGEAASTHAARAVIDVSAGLPAQGFELRCDADGVRIRAADEAGLRYGRACLGQLEAQFPGALPALLIRDWPDFERRGFMLDISRDRVPTLASLRALVDMLAGLRMNELQLYTEHTFAYAGHETVWRDASPMTPDEVRELDTYCARAGVELVPNQNSFGHMERWLRHDAYRGLAESPGSERAACLYPDDASFALVRGLWEELLPNFSSRRCNIDCDETFELGEGRSRERVEREGRGPVYLEFVLRLVDHLQSRGMTVQLWGDIVREHPELISRLPETLTKRLTLLAWGYDAPLDPAALPAPVRERLDRLGVGDDRLRGFAPHVEPFAAAGLDFYVCPGTSSWNSLCGRWPNAAANLLDAAESGRAAGASGYLITDWGDRGHLQPPPVSWPGLVYGAALAWSVDANRELDVTGALADHVLPAQGAGRAEAETLIRLGSLYPATGLDALNSTALFQSLMRPLDAPLLTWGEVAAGGLAAVVAELTATIEGGGGGRVARELRQAARLARHGAWRLARRNELPAPGADALRADLHDAIAEQARVWSKRSRPGGLPDSLARLERALEDY